jgi:hypothetical protein
MQEYIMGVAKRKVHSLELKDKTALEVIRGESTDGVVDLLYHFKQYG